MTLGSHQRTVGLSQAHFTPRLIVDALGPFNLDPCAGEPRPWDCAADNYTRDGLERPWRGLVWLNPPFDRYQVGKWVERLAEHGTGIALLHARTETAWFKPCWQAACGMLFLAQRLKFCDAAGRPQRANSGAPPVLVAFGPDALERLRMSSLKGNLVTQWRTQ